MARPKRRDLPNAGKLAMPHTDCPECGYRGCVKWRADGTVCTRCLTVHMFGDEYPYRLRPVTELRPARDPLMRHRDA